MICAIYVRKSTEQSGVSEDQKSITRQIEHATAYARTKGWTVSQDHVYSDDGVSGAEFGDRRPGFIRLMNALKPKPPFQILVMSEESRLGREQIKTAYALQQLTEAGVQVWFYLTDQERKCDTAMEKIIGSFTSFASEIEREKAQQRTYDAMKRKAKAGHVAGGRVYGYTNFEILSSALDAYGRPKRDHVELRIHEEQAAVVRTIFQLCAAGKGMVSIAQRLNAEGLPAPGTSDGRRKTWGPSSVRTVLFRRTYLGELIWNKTKKRNPSGVQQPRKRPEKDWLTIPMPQLRIISDAEWKSAHDRLTATRAIYLRGTNGNLWGRPASTLDSKYLLTGLVKCGLCGGSLYVKSHVRKDGRALFYGCTNFHLHGRAACTNGTLISMEAANKAVLSVLENDVLHPDVTDTVVKKAMAKFRASQQDKTRNIQQYDERLTVLETEVGRLVAAIAAGGDIPALVVALKECTERQAALSHERAELNRAQAVLTEADFDALEQELKDHFRHSWETMLTRQIEQTRQILRKLFNGERIPFEPRTFEREVQVEFNGTASIGRLVTGQAKALMSARGCHHARGLSRRRSPAPTRPIPW
jgi:site-specific DNA recombinase